MQPEQIGFIIAFLIVWTIFLIWFTKGIKHKLVHRDDIVIVNDIVFTKKAMEVISKDILKLIETIKKYPENCKAETCTFDVPGFDSIWIGNGERSVDFYTHNEKEKERLLKINDFERKAIWLMFIAWKEWYNKTKFEIFKDEFNKEKL